MEKFKWLIAVIAAHPEHKLFGRTRLQKTIKLLQRLGAPIDYDYTMHFYGPYSEGVQADIGLLAKLGLVEEKACTGVDGNTYYVLRAHDAALSVSDREEIRNYQEAIDAMSEADAVVLELAATYDAFREMGSNHEQAMGRLRQKKEAKCDGGRTEQALELLRSIGLDYDELRLRKSAIT